MNSRHTSYYTLLAALLSVMAFACNDPEYRLPEDAGAQDSGQSDLDTAADLPATDASKDDMADVTDMPEDDAGDMPVDASPPYEPRFGEIVEVDLTPYTGPVEGATGGATVFKSTSRDQLLKGPLAHGSVGDFVLENEHARFVVERDTRAMSPCPFGGNVLDGGYKSAPEAEPLEDNMGEVCLLANISQTFFPESFEILSEGSTTEPAILAITGRLDLLDFLNFGGLVSEFLGDIIELPIDLNKVDDATLTMYYILRPGDHGMRVVTALRNEGQEQLDIVMGHLITGGGTGGYFNPLGTERGFGDEALDASNLDGVKFPFMVWRGEQASYGYVPEPDPTIMNTDLPAGGVTLYAAGASATLLNRDSLLATALASKAAFKRLEGVFHLQPGESDFVTHQVFVGDGGLNTILDHVYPNIGLEHGTISGQITDAMGAPVQGARVSAISDKERAINQALTDASGNYTMTVPVGAYRVEARAPGAPTITPVDVQVAANADAQGDLELALAATLRVSVTTPDAQPTPARVTVWCVNDCPAPPTSQLEDTSSDRLPGNVAAIVPTGLDGTATVNLPGGDYRVTVSRGMEWSLWPSDGHLTGGELITLVNGQEIALDAEIAHVVRTPGVLSGDFHIHGLTSTDSAVSQQNRVLDYISEGVDVMVSTDHDYISDYRPAIEALGAQEQVISLIGSEITTSDTGHLNAFPLQRDPTDPRGGALDWGNGSGDSLLPSEIFDWINGFPGEQVIQVNHPEGMGTINALQVDVLRGISTADPESKRLPVLDPDPVTGDTRLWAENFTAMELMNDHSLSNYWTIARWWMTMVGRGFSPTMTAVTDSHKRWANVGGVPRTMVFVGDETDTTTSFERDVFARAVNDGRAIGTNGPMFTIELRNSAGERVGLGQTLDAQADGRIFGTVNVEMPEWILVDSLDIYTNREDVIVPAGEQVDTELPPNMSVDIDLDPQTDLEVVATGQSVHRRWVKQVEFEMTVDADAYIIVMVRGRKQGSRNMRPVVTDGIKPMAFSNPIFVDFDGDGYNNPPLEELSKTPPPVEPPSGHSHGHGHHHHHDDGDPTKLTREKLWHVIDNARCTH